MATAKRSVRLTFKRRLMLLVAMAVSLPALATCVVLGLQLDRQARALFVNDLQADLDTFALLVAESHGRLADGIRRTAGDNTLQVTLDLEIRGQLASYVEAQRQILGAEFLAVFDKDGRAMSIARAGDGGGSPWRLAPSATATCSAQPGAERQLLVCDGVAYLVSTAVIQRSRGGVGDATGERSAMLGNLLGGTRVASPALLAAAQEHRLGHTLIWVQDEMVHSSLSPRPVLAIAPSGPVREYEVGGTAYLGAARATQIGGRSLTVGLLAPLAPLRRALVESVTTVAAIGVAVVIATLLMLSLFVNRILRPISQLREGALRIGEGDLTHRISVDTGDELQDLADRFNDMSEKLQVSYTSLEGKVRERTRELSESLQWQTATADVLKVISGSKFDLQPVLDAIVQATTRLCHAAGTAIFLREGDGFRLAASNGLSLAYESFLRQHAVAATRATLVGRTAIDKRLIHIPDVLEDREYDWPQSQQLGHLRTVLAVPLMRQGESAGVLVLIRQVVEPFGDRQIELVVTFADQAVIAVENERLFQEVQAHTRELAQSRLRRFLAPQVAEMLVAAGDREVVLESRRKEVTVVFCDLRGFTAFAEGAEPEEVMAMLHDYHAGLGNLIFRFEGTLERFVGDGLLVVFNDPLPCPDHPLRAVRMAIEMREAMDGLLQQWRRLGHNLGFGIGIAQGYATVGPIGFDRRLDYAVVGSIPNMASRLCDQAETGQILVSQRVMVSTEGTIAAKHVGDLNLKGFQRPVPAYEVVYP